MSRIELLGVLSSLSDGGAERAVVRILNDQAGRKRVALVVLKSDRSILPLISPDVVLIDLSRRIIPLFSFFILLLRSRPQVLFSTFGDINVLMAIVKRIFLPGSRLVLREPNSLDTKFRKSGLVRRLYPFVYPWATSVVVLSKRHKLSMLSIIARSGGASNVVVVHNAPAYRCSVEGGYKVDGPYFISVGRLVEQKGYDNLIDAFSTFTNDFDDYKLIIVGSGAEKDKLQQRLAGYGLEGKVVLTGALDNPLDLVLGASAYILSSRYEGVSNAMLEALMLGVPVLAALENTSADEFVIDGYNGWCVKNSSRDCLLEGMSSLVKEGVAWGRREISKNYSEMCNEKHMLESYDRLFWSSRKIFLSEG